MQTIWSRAAQVRLLCNCPTCLSVTAATARRTTAATARRGVPRGDVYTLFASSLAATAAIYDSHAKDARSEQWEKVISETKAKLQAKEEEHDSRLAALSDEPGHQRGSLRGLEQFAKDSWRDIRQDGNKDSWPDVFHWAAQQDAARAAAGFQDFKGPSLSLLKRLSPKALERLVTNGGLLRRFYGGSDCNSLDDRTSTTFSAKKMKSLEWSTAKLGLKLVFYATCSTKPVKEGLADVSEQELQLYHIQRLEYSLTEHRYKTVHQPHNIVRKIIPHSMNLEERLAKIEERIYRLRAGGPDANSQFYKEFESPQKPRFRGVRVPNHGDSAFELNRYLGQILEPSSGLNKSQVASRIGNSLLRSDVPPNIHTYNILLAHFSHLDIYELFRAVLTSMRESHVRPNELTHAIALRYFTNTGKDIFFMDYVLRMEGFSQGMALAHPKTRISSITRHLYHVNRTYRTNEKIAEDKIVERARMNGEVYEALITGALRFLGPQNAMQYYRDMVNEGWKASNDLLITILKSCCRLSDWVSGLSIWHQLAVGSDAVSTRAFEWMLCLCQACDQQEIFKQVLQDGVNAGALPSSMLPLSDHVKLSRSGLTLKATDMNEQDLFSRRQGSDGDSVSWVEQRIKHSIANETLIKDEEKPPFTPRFSVLTKSAPAGQDPHRVRGFMAESKAPKASSQAPTVNSLVRRVASSETYDKKTKATLVHYLSRKIMEINQEDSMKMSSEEFKRHWSGPTYLAKTGQSLSRHKFESFKTSADLTPDLADHKLPSHHAPPPSTSLDLSNYVARPGSLSSDDQYMAHFSDFVPDIPMVSVSSPA